MMKKIIPIILIALLGFAKEVNSQVLIGLLFGEKLNKGPIEFGLDLVINRSQTTIDNGSEPNSRLGFGLYMDYKLNPNLILSGSLFFASPKGEKNFNEKDPLYNLTDSLLVGSKTLRELNYFELPIMLEYRAYERIGLGVGAYVSYMSNAYDYYELSTDDGDITHKRSVLSEMNRLDYGFMAGLHYHFKGNPGSQIQLVYEKGLADLLKDGSRGNGQNEVWQIGVMIPIKFGVLPDETNEE